MRRHVRAVAGLVLLLIVGAGVALAQSSQHFDLSWNAIVGGGGDGASSHFTFTGTVGQSPAGTMSSAHFRVVGGFLAAFEPTFTPTPTATGTPTNTPAATPTRTATPPAISTATAVPPTATRTATPPASSTATAVPPTATPNATGTVTRTPTITPTPYPLPNVGVQVAPSGGALQATLAARDAGCNNNTQNNQLLSLQFTRLTNATVDVGPPASTTVTGPITIPLASHPASIQLTVRRVTPGQPTTVELTVTDGCGSWPTFVGGGPTAF